MSAPVTEVTSYVITTDGRGRLHVVVELTDFM